LVPHVPPASFDSYKHASPTVWYKGLLHELFRYLIDHDVLGQMKLGDKYIECLPEDETRCANNPQAYSIADHIRYFETMFVLHGFVGCKSLNFAQLFGLN
jgi:hypothetical protein